MRRNGVAAAGFSGDEDGASGPLATVVGFVWPVRRRSCIEDVYKQVCVTLSGIIIFFTGQSSTIWAASAGKV